MNSIQFIKNEIAAAVARGVRQCVMIGSQPALGAGQPSCAGSTQESDNRDSAKPQRSALPGSYWEEAIAYAPDQTVQVFAVEDESKALAAALENSNFDRLKASLFFWLAGQPSCAWSTQESDSQDSAKPQRSALPGCYLEDGQPSCAWSTQESGNRDSAKPQRNALAGCYFEGGAGTRTIDAAIDSLAFIASLPAGSGVVLDYAEERTSLGSLTHTALDALASRITMAGNSVKHLIQPQAVAALLRGVGFKSIVDVADDELHICGGHLVSAVV